jgi:hypothetical protein
MDPLVKPEDDEMVAEDDEVVAFFFVLDYLNFATP